MINRITQKNVSEDQRKLEEILLTEKFRQILLRNKIAGDYIFYQADRSGVQGTVVITKSKKRERYPWIVYEVDRDGEEFLKEKYQTQKLALVNAAKRRGVTIEASDLIIKKKPNGRVDIYKEYDTARSAITFFRTISNFYESAPEGIRARENIELLNKTFNTVSLKSIKLPNAFVKSIQQHHETHGFLRRQAKSKRAKLKHSSIVNYVKQECDSESNQAKVKS